MRQKLHRDIEKSTIIIRDFNIPISKTEKTSRKSAIYRSLEQSSDLTYLIFQELPTPKLQILFSCI